jgi:Ser/Thr protein kinase RdoA (MazF antagonist)
METPRPPLSSIEAAQIAADCFGVVGQARELPAEFDRNFLITAVDGGRYVLKVSHGMRPAEDLEMQVAVLQLLAGTDVGDRVPRVVESDSGASLIRLSLAEGSEHWVRTLSYLSGSPLAELTSRPTELIEGIGGFLGALDLSLAGFDHPGARRRIPWDLARLMDLAENLPLIDDAARRRVVQDHLDRFDHTVVSRLDQLGRSVIHNDANDYNLLVDPLDPGRARLVGLIDFGDMIHTITVAEPAIAAAYLMLNSDTPWQTAARVVRGYHEVRPLDPSEREVFPDLVVARLCASVLMSAKARHREPDNEYLLVSEQPVWRRLENLDICDPDELFRFVTDGRSTSRR